MGGWREGRGGEGRAEEGRGQPLTGPPGQVVAAGFKPRTHAAVWPA